MTPIARAHRALQEALAIDPGAIRYLLERYAVVKPAMVDHPNMVVDIGCEDAPNSITGMTLLNCVLHAATGERLRPEIANKAITGFSICHRRAPLCDDFDPYQGWEGHDDAIDYIRRQPDARVALQEIVRANIDADEIGWTAELLKRADHRIWDPPSTHVLEAAAAMLFPLRPSYQEGALLTVSSEGCVFDFGEENGEIDFNFKLPGEKDWQPGEGKCSATASCTRIAEFIRERVKHVTQTHKASPPPRRYRAVPILAYVPLTEDQNADEARAIDTLRSDLELRVFLAEDFEAGIAEETDDEDLSAMIGTACEPT